MRAKEEVLYLRAHVGSLIELLNEERAERTRLVNALLAKSSGEFKLRQAASGPEPLVAMPREAKDARPQPMGM